MSSALFIPTKADKGEKYKLLLPQIESLTHGETDLIANLANITAALHDTFGWLWVGFYLVKEQELVLAPFQGPIACTRIKYGKGVCGKVWENAISLFVPDVNQFSGHIACSSQSVAEIVIPVFDNAGKVFGVLDVDSERFDVLDETDVIYLEKVSELVTTLI
jgi:GAF domain-containing protein